MIWCKEKVLLVRTSYRSVWTAPGGSIEGSEFPVDAAVREVSEELGLQLSGDVLHLALISEHYWDNRHDRVHLFETQLSELPAIELDNREIVGARFVTLAEALSFDLPPYLRDYFRLKADPTAILNRLHSANYRGGRNWSDLDQ
jgi:8-oxo-dGTP pyrophosphatase MutT (NUDIX family)